MKYKVEVGEFVEYIRVRNLTVYANSEVEAIEKADDKFVNEMQKNPSCHDIFERHFDSIELVEGR